MERGRSEGRSAQKLGIVLGDRGYLATVQQGLIHPRDNQPAVSLIADYVALDAGNRVLIGPCGDGLLGAWAADSVGDRHTVCMDSNAIATETTRQNLAANGHGAVRVDSAVPGHTDGPFDLFLMLLPKGRDLARLWLLNGALATRTGGHIVIAGPNSGGIQSFARDAASLLGDGRLLGYRKGNRALMFERPPLMLANIPAPFREAGILNGTFSSYPLDTAQRHLTIYTRPGVFSRDGLDDGTRMLLSVMSFEAEDTVLDLGCGSGVIGLFACLAVNPRNVTMVDVDSLAIECSLQTLASNGIEGPTVLQSVGFESIRDRRFRTIVTNPPFHSGHRVTTAMTEAFIRDAFDALVPGGRLMLVANRFLPYEHPLCERFGTVQTLAADGRYQVFLATRP